MTDKDQKQHKIVKRKKQADPTRYYIDHAEYTQEVIKYIQTQKASERLGELWKMHVDRCGSAACFKSYTYLDEMKGYALLFLVKYSKSFKPEKQIAAGKVPNAFSYCTTIIHRAFIQIINKEKRHSKLKDKFIKLHQRIIYNLNSFNVPTPIDD